MVFLAIYPSDFHAGVALHFGPSQLCCHIQRPRIVFGEFFLKKPIGILLQSSALCYLQAQTLRQSLTKCRRGNYSIFINTVPANPGV